MGDGSRLLLCGLLACVAVAGCSAFGGGSVEVTPADATVSVEMTVDHTEDTLYDRENDTVSILMRSSGERKEYPFEKYACMMADPHAAGVVHEMIEDRIAGDPAGYSTAASDRVEVKYYSDLSVPRSALEKVTPERVVVSVQAFEQETRCVVPVRVSDGGSMEAM